MIKFRNISKWLLVLVTLIFVFYTLLWVLVTYTIANDLDKSYAGKKFPLSDDGSISFSKARAAGFPFRFVIELHDFVEENTSTVIQHKAPFKIGYDLLNQIIFSEYKGESFAKYKPVEAGFGARIEGAYKVQAHVPFNSTLLSVFLLQAEPIEMMNFVNYFNIQSRDVHIYDLKDNSVIIADADLDVKFSVKHHEYYDSIDELIADIPNDYHFSFSATTKDAAPGRRPVPFSLIYWTYLPTDFSYNIDLDLHTEAKKFSFEDILKNFTLKTNKMDFYSKLENSKSQLSINRSTIDEKNNKIALDYTTKLKFGAEFSEYLAGSIDTIVKSIPTSSPLALLKNYLLRIDTRQIDFNTGDDSLELSIKASASREDKKVNLDISDLSLYLKDKGFDLKMNANNNFKGEWIKGVFQITHMEEIVEYLTKLSFRLDKSQDNPLMMSDDFWKKLYVDYIKTIANNYNEENGNATLEFTVNNDVEKTMWGKYPSPKSTLIYYKKLYKQLEPYTNNATERMKIFRMMIPSKVDKPEIIQKMTKE